MGLYTLRTGASSHPEESVLQHLTDMLVSGGVLELTTANKHFFVEAQGTPDMTVKVNDGRAYIKGSTGNAYPVRLDTDTNATITANSTGNPRIDAVVVYVDKSAAADTTSSNVAILYVVAGTAAASPVAPTDAAIQSAVGASNPFERLADVAVANGASSISNSNITDKRAKAEFRYMSDVNENLIVNSCFDVAQLGTSFTSASTPANSDDTYLLDMWNLISDGNDAVDLSQESSEVPDGASYSLKLDVETSKRFGVVQFMEFKEARKLKGQIVSLSFWVKSANISAIRAAVLSWGSTADAITSDIVSSWADTPTWAANWTAENTPADLPVTSSWTEVRIEGIEIDSATVNNLALAIWLPNEETIGDIIYVSKVQLNRGSGAMPYQPRSAEEDLEACHRVYYRFPTSGQGNLYTWFAIYLSRSAVLGQMLLQFPVKMRVVPTMASGGAFACSGATYVSMALDSNGMSTSGGAINITTTGGVAGQASLLSANNNAATYIAFDARL